MFFEAAFDEAPAADEAAFGDETGIARVFHVSILPSLPPAYGPRFWTLFFGTRYAPADMQLLSDDHFSAIFAPLVGKRVGLVDGQGNVGDHLIWRGTRQLLDRAGIDWHQENFPGGRFDGPGNWLQNHWRRTVWPRSLPDVLLLFGGGNMGSDYVQPYRIRQRALGLGVPAIVLPQSFMSVESGPYLRVFIREEDSRQFCPQGILAPDMALGYRYDREVQPVHTTGLFLRQDAEALFPEVVSLGDPVALSPTVDDYLALAGSAEHILTDRLHFAVAGLLNRRRVTLLPNTYHKNRSMWECWLKDLGCEWADTPAI